MEPVKNGQPRKCCDSIAGGPHGEGCVARIRNNQPKNGYSLLEWDYTFDSSGELIRDENGRPIMRPRTKAEVKTLKAMKDEAWRDNKAMENQIRRADGLITGRRVA